MRTFYTMCIIQDTEDSKPWLCACTESFLTIEEARAQIIWYRQNFRVLCSWIQEFEGLNKIADHDATSYINVLGYLKGDE